MKSPTEKQKIARERNWRICQLKSMFYALKCMQRSNLVTLSGFLIADLKSDMEYIKETIELIKEEYDEALGKGAEK